MFLPLLDSAGWTSRGWCRYLLGMHALEFLADKTPFPNVPIVAMYGAERYFRPEVLRRIPGASGEDAELSLTRITGEAADAETLVKAAQASAVLR